ncbi:AMP-dependent synthetase [Streptomyces tateyamensis]|uniref:AMP-dependent synthetase n=1 Tax=Streptomyces tateyamensis TaxID=565073 RepID=A0A2V4N2S9_9ACTN|nr:AMP-dependent synthetase [Streptomyces tateyamensis]
MVNRITAEAPVGGRISFARLDGTETFSLAELHARAGRLAASLAELGIGPGDRIGILAANSPQWVLLDLAALWLGAQTAGFEPGKFDPDQQLITRYGLRLLFTDRPSEAAEALPLTEVDRLVEKADSAPEPVSWAAWQVTTVKFTSGSTGEPKGLGATAGSIDSSLRAVQDMFHHRPGDDLFVFLPLSLLQQRYWVYSALRHGHDVTISTYEAAFATMRRARPTVVMGVPAYYETARRQLESRAARSGKPAAELARQLFGDRIRYLWTGSAPAAPAMLRFFTEAGLPIYEGYGLNETCIVAKNHPGASREGSVGRVVVGKEVLLDADGVISVRSDHPVNDHYEYAAPGDSEKVFRPGGLVRTGDLGLVDEDGYLYILGRADDVIVLENGKKVVVRPIEEQLRAGGAITEAVLFCPQQTDLVAVVCAAAQPPDERAIAAALNAANAALGKDERISRAIVATEPFTVENGLLTSQFKPRRPQIRAAYATELANPQEGIHAH